MDRVLILLDRDPQSVVDQLTAEGKVVLSIEEFSPDTVESLLKAVHNTPVDALVIAVRSEELGAILTQLKQFTSLRIPVYIVIAGMQG